MSELPLNEDVQNEDDLYSDIVHTNNSDSDIDTESNTHNNTYHNNNTSHSHSDTPIQDTNNNKPKNRPQVNKK